MANTIKFGDGQWATKEDSILAYNDENANFKPLPFVTSRASTATRVNKAGLLETVASGVPRVDYLDNSKGSYLIEPSSTNLITQSEAFGNSYWTKSGATIEGDASTAGTEKVTNGNFATDTDWTKGTGWTISGGVLNLTNVNSSTTQFSVWEVGKMYLVTVDYNFVSGNRLILPYDGTNQASIITSASSGTSSYYYTPSATTMYIYSDGNGNGSIDNVSVKEIQGFSAPSVDSPLGAFKLVPNNVAAFTVLYQQGVSVTVGNNYTFSIICKKAGYDFIQITGGAGMTTTTWINFNINTGEFLGKSTSVVDYDINSLENGWFKISVTFLSDSTNANGGCNISALDQDRQSRLPSFTGDGTSGVYIFGAQLEQKSYATSYIKTSGSQITRLAETASKSGLSASINSTEGVLYAEIARKDPNIVVHKFGLNDGSKVNQIVIETRGLNDLRVTFIENSNFTVLSNTSVHLELINKISVVWNLNRLELWLNGFKVAEDLSIGQISSNSLNTFAFSEGDGTDKTYQITKDLRIYKTALTSLELTTLTSYSSFNEMALAQNYKIQ